MQLLKGLPTRSMDELAHCVEFSLISIIFPFLLPLSLSFWFWWTAKCAGFAALNFVSLHSFDSLPQAAFEDLHCHISLLFWRHDFLFFPLHLPSPGNCQDLQLNCSIINFISNSNNIVFYFLLSPFKIILLPRINNPKREAPVSSVLLYLTSSGDGMYLISPLKFNSRGTYYQSPG